jgi:glucose-6-phosphate isomerase
MKFNMNKFKGNTTIFRVKDAIKEGKNIYKNIRGHENEINEVLVDLPDKKTGFKDHKVCMNTLYPGKVNGEFRMTRGHYHNVEEIYIVLGGRGNFIFGGKRFSIKKGDILTIPKNVWHRTVNTGKEKIVFLTIFEKHEESHLKSY